MKPVMLCIMDGFGCRDDARANAIDTARTPNLDKLFAAYPHTQIGASGMDVGLPDGQMGNSEVGHTNIGAGRVVYQELTRITKAIRDGEFFENDVLKSAMENAKKPGAALHLYGLLSDGGVHSHNTHLYGLLEMAKREGVENVFIHCFMDGRDTPPASGKDYVKELMAKCEEIGVGKIATICGRYYAMDRDNRWDRVQKAYNALVLGEGETAACGVCAMQNSYDAGNTDEFVLPTVIEGTGRIKAGDSVVFFNFRPDRAREITRTLVDPEFNGFERSFFPLNYVCFTQYDATMPNVEVAFKPQSLKNTLGEYLAACGKTQLRIAETEKYAHVTFFFNGGVEAPNANEDRVLIASPKVTTYDLKPDMSANEVCDKAVELIGEGKYDVMILNFANCDMVGHTGIMAAAQEAVKTVDACVGKVVDAVLATGGAALITADHGNADMMVDPATGEAFTAHTTNKVPFILVDPTRKDAKLREDGCLADLAPTLLELLGLEQPAEMSGKSLIAK